MRSGSRRVESIQTRMIGSQSEGEQRDHTGDVGEDQRLSPDSRIPVRRVS